MLRADISRAGVAEIWDPDGEGRLAYAASSATDLQAPAVRQLRTSLYLDPNIEQEFQSAVEAKPVDSGENLVVLLSDGAGVFYIETLFRILLEAFCPVRGFHVQLDFTVLLA